MIKNLPANAGDVGLPLGWEDPLEKEPSPVFLPGTSHGQSILGWGGGGYSPWTHKSQVQLNNNNNLYYIIIFKYVLPGSVTDRPQFSSWSQTDVK